MFLSVCVCCLESVHLFDQKFLAFYSPLPFPTSHTLFHPCFLEALAYVRQIWHVSGRAAWELTEDGKRNVVIGRCFKLGHRVLQAHDKPVEEMSVYELLVSLNSCGFSLRCVQGKKGRLRVQREAGYKPGESEKIWYMPAQSAKTLSRINIWYLRCLLKAADIGVAIPHLAPSDTYRRLLDPDYNPPPQPQRKRQFQSEGDEWHLLGSSLRKKPRKEQRRKAQADVAAAVVADHSERGASSGSSSSSSSSSSSPSSSTSSRLASSSSRSASETAIAQKEDKDKEEEEEQVPKDEFKKAKEDSTDNAETIDKYHSKIRRPPRSLPFGQCFLTARYNKGALSGYQMTCTRACHQEGRRCTKELSFGVAGGQELCQRMLMAWIVFGSTVPDRSTHMGQCWKLIVQMKQEAGLPSVQELEACAPGTWQDVEHIEEANDHPQPLPTPLALRGRCVRPLLGEPLADVPQAVHQAMEHLAGQGFLPITTPAQRRRARFTPGSTYGVPDFLADARRYAYVHPNLPPPSGYIWRLRAGPTWVLCKRGG